MLLRKFSILVVGFFVVIALAIGVSYDRYVLRRDYLIQMRVDCDPIVERCFVGVCDPEAGEVCPENPEEGTYYYAIALRNARSFSGCGLNSEDCSPGACRDNESECAMRYCTNESAEAGVECSDPETFATELSVDETGLDGTDSSDEAVTDDTIGSEEGVIGQDNTDQ